MKQKTNLFKICNNNLNKNLINQNLKKSILKIKQNNIKK